MFMKKLLLVAATASMLYGCAATQAGGGPSAAYEVTDAGERLRVAMVDPSAPALDALVANELSYGHSNGKVDNKTTFVNDLLEGRSDFVTLIVTDQTVTVSGDTAIVRHNLTADINDRGIASRVSLKVLGIWQKQGGQWKLLARQAVRFPQ